MKTWVRKSLNVGVLSAGFLLVASGAAQADSITGNNTGAGDGNQLGTNGQAPVTVDGNSVAFLGLSDAAGGGSAGATAAGEGMATGNNSGLLGGNQASTLVQVPVNACGNSIAVFGSASANAGYGPGSGTVHTMTASRHVTGSAHSLNAHNVKTAAFARKSNEAAGLHARSAKGGATATGGNGGALTTGDNGGVLTGNQAVTTVQAPVNASGNASGILGWGSAASA
jgi:hypothetical protein